MPTDTATNGSDASDPEEPIGTRVEEGDVIAFDRYRSGGEWHDSPDGVQGAVAIATDDILRVRGIGAVDTKRDHVIEIIERNGDR